MRNAPIRLQHSGLHCPRPFPPFLIHSSSTTNTRTHLVSSIQNQDAMFGKFAENLKQQAVEQITQAVQQHIPGKNQNSQPQTDNRTKVHMTSNCSGRKKAVFIGINYFGTKAALRGCINDVNNISSYLFQSFGFSRNDSIILTDDQTDPSKKPTKANIVNAFRWLVSDVQPNDSLFLHYSGHGGTQADKDGDEIDKFDETLIPVDYEHSGQITDDELHQYLVKPLPAGVRLTALFDCCHSGSILDLPFTYNCKGDIELTVNKNHVKEGLDMLMGAGVHFQSGNRAAAIQQLTSGVKLFVNPPPPANSAAQQKTEKEKVSEADVLCFSGCRDDQTSADAHIDSNFTGAMSHALIKVLNEHGKNQKYTDLLTHLRDVLRGKYSQIPQMSSGRLVNLDTGFLL